MADDKCCVNLYSMCKNVAPSKLGWMEAAKHLTLATENLFPNWTEPLRFASWLLDHAPICIDKSYKSMKFGKSDKCSQIPGKKKYIVS